MSIVGNLSVLGFFKYFNFFVGSFQSLLSYFSIPLTFSTLHIILPIGISFYTFKTISYTIDVFRGNLEPERSFRDYALYVAFFPQLIAGPIERAGRLLPQIRSPRKVTLDQFYEGSYLIMWGLFEKMLLADNLARVADRVFGGPPYSGADVLLAAYAFTIQIFCDFDGYSNISRGLARCMGFDTMVNFNLPYFATSPREFWRRWHISLSNWLRDYLYISFGGNRKGKLNTYKNTMLTMLIGGLWHGAAWTFVIWGAYHGALLVLQRIAEPILKLIPPLKSTFARQLWFLVSVFLFFQLISLGWLIFRAQSMGQVFAMLNAVASNFSTSAYSLNALIVLVPLVSVLLVVQFFQYRRTDLLFLFRQHWAVKAVALCAAFYLILVFGVTGGHEFIYFQF